MESAKNGGGGGGYKAALAVISGVQISFRRLTKVGATIKFWLKLTDVTRHFRKVGHLLTTKP